VPGTGLPIRVHDTASGAVLQLTPGPTARMYVCGITPYDATHIGHAATYVTFDLLGRALRDAGHEVLYVQNVPGATVSGGRRWQTRRLLSFARI
jgi:L-cysteine:1D-myo-inositol 2-amino-2-deoxy-alpha-D-glucopyranoside ligase